MQVVFLLIILWFIIMLIIWFVSSTYKKEKEKEEKNKKDEIMLVRVGDKIKIIEMKGEPNYKGRGGIVKEIDDYGLLHGTWGSLAIDLHEDTIKVMNKWETNTRETTKNIQTK